MFFCPSKGGIDMLVLNECASANYTAEPTGLSNRTLYLGRNVSGKPVCIGIAHRLGLYKDFCKAFTHRRIEALILLRTLA